jgi:hypothetical protein
MLSVYLSDNPYIRKNFLVGIQIALLMMIRSGLFCRDAASGGGS